MRRNQVLETLSSTPIALFAEGLQLGHSISVMKKCFYLSAVCYQHQNHFYDDALRLDRNQNLDFRRIDDQENVDPSAIGPGDLTDTLDTIPSVKRILRRKNCPPRLPSEPRKLSPTRINVLGFEYVRAQSQGRQPQK